MTTRPRRYSPAPSPNGRRCSASEPSTTPTSWNGSLTSIRREYTAVGIRTALHPQVDIATEPRWSRASTTFGSNAEIVGTLGAAYVRGLQGAEDWS